MEKTGLLCMLFHERKDIDPKLRPEWLNMMADDLKPMPEWVEVAAEYKALNVAFPMDAVAAAVLGNLEYWEEAGLVIRGRGWLAEGRESAETLARVRDEIKAWRPNEIPNQQQIVADLAAAARCAEKRAAVAEGEGVGWEVTEDGAVRTMPTEGAGNRRRSYFNKLVCDLYFVLQPAYEEAFEDTSKNPGRLREHISRILAPTGCNEDLDPKANKPIHRAIKNRRKPSIKP